MVPTRGELVKTEVNNSIRITFLPFALPSIGEEEIQEVSDSLRSGWITTGPKTKMFEDQFRRFVNAKHAIAVSSCTAGLHIALTALNIGVGDEVIVPTLTFCSTANVVEHVGARPILVDVDENFQISLDAIERAVTHRTKAVVPVHYAGQACDMDTINTLAAKHGLSVIEDAAHAAGSEYKGKKIGTHSKASVFSFYATKNMTTGEGGIITTDDDQLAERMQVLSLHGMSRDAWKRYSATSSWYYDVVEPGYKNNMTDIQASLGLHQLRRLEGFIQRRKQLALRYQTAFRHASELILPGELPHRTHTYHLFPIRLRPELLAINRDQFIVELRDRNIGTSVHFIPVHRHSFYAKKYHYRREDFPMAEQIFSGLISLPLYPLMSDSDADDVTQAVSAIVAAKSLKRSSRSVRLERKDEVVAQLHP
jgi:dTDP-4-amino-4,6-dideoxygalactose transaminase